MRSEKFYNGGIPSAMKVLVARNDDRLVAILNQDDVETILACALLAGIFQLDSAPSLEQVFGVLR